MRKRLVAWGLTAEMLMDCGNVMLAALNLSLIHLKLKYHGTFTYITQIVQSNAHLNPFKMYFSDKSLIIAHKKTDIWGYLWKFCLKVCNISL